MIKYLYKTHKNEVKHTLIDVSCFSSFFAYSTLNIDMSTADNHFEIVCDCSLYTY